MLPTDVFVKCGSIIHFNNLIFVFQFAEPEPIFGPFQLLGFDSIKKHNRIILKGGINFENCSFFLSSYSATCQDMTGSGRLW